MCSEPFRAPFAAVYQAMQTASMPCCQLAPMHLGLRQCPHNGLTGPCILGMAYAYSHGGGNRRDVKVCTEVTFQGRG